ncbi:MAG: hypothetical protein WKG07_48410 [Hymenobacter sp.]
MEDAGFQAPAADGSGVQVIVSSSSDRLQLLEPFKPWEGTDLIGSARAHQSARASAPPTTSAWPARG